VKREKREKPFGVRMNPDLKNWLRVKARENHRSLNSEVCHVLEKYRAQGEGASHAS
jgi:predicted HicB family RNase H-like nuclease